MIRATFYNGHTAKGRPARVVRQLHELHLIDLEDDREVIFPIDKLELQKGREHINLLYNDQIIELSKTDYLRLGLEEKLKKSELPLVAKIASIVIPSVVLLWYFSGPLVQGMAKAIPESLFDGYIEETISYFKEQHCLNKEQNKSLEKIFLRLGEDPKKYKIYVNSSPDANAFASLGNLIIINHGLIRAVDSAEALAGIIAHELAHIKNDHVKRKFVKNLAVTAVWDFTLGRSSVHMLKSIAGDVFTQAEEKEADQISAKLLKDKQISHAGTRKFFEDMSKEDESWTKYLVFSHPSYPDRIQLFQGTHKSKAVLSTSEWKLLSSGCQNP